MRLSGGILLEIIVIFTGLKGKIEWGEWGPCTRLNREIEQFLHEAEWGSCTRLSKAASDRKLSVCLCKNVVHNWIDISRAETSCEEIENQVKCYKKKENQQLREFLELYLDQCLIALNLAPFLP